MYLIFRTALWAVVVVDGMVRLLLFVGDCVEVVEG